MEEAKDKPKERKIYWNANEIFKPLSEETFHNMVMPFIKAYYKHEYGNELYLHDHENLDEIYIVVHVDRDVSHLTYYNEEGDYDSKLESEIRNDRQDLTPENIFDYLYYEYKELFGSDSSPSVPENIKQEPKKKIKITL